MLIAKVIPKLITYFGPNIAFHAISKAATHPLCFAGDFAQLTLELLGYEKAAKIAGASGNVVGGGLAGFGVGGPLGAVVGTATGLSVWGIGEYVELDYLEPITSGVEYFSTASTWVGGFITPMTAAH